MSGQTLGADTFGGTATSETEHGTPASTNGKLKGMMLTRQAMREVKDFNIKPVQMHDCDFYFYVRSLGDDATLKLAEFGDVETDADGAVIDVGETRQKNLTRMIGVILMCGCDEAGELLFTEPEQDEQWLRQRKFASIVDAFNACLDVSGLSKDGMEEIKGN
jgi:hypothetical protein